MAYATGRCMCHRALRLPFEVDDVVAMVRKVFAGRAAFHDGEDEIVPGVTVHHIGGHSKGLQSVRVKTKRGYVVLAADASHLYAHMDGGRVFPLTYNVARGGRRLPDAEKTRDLAAPRRARPRSAGARALSGGQARARRLGRAARRRAEGIATIRCSVAASGGNGSLVHGGRLTNESLRSLRRNAVRLPRREFLSLTVGAAAACACRACLRARLSDAAGAHVRRIWRRRHARLAVAPDRSVAVASAWASPSSSRTGPAPPATSRPRRSSSRRRTATRCSPAFGERHQRLALPQSRFQFSARYRAGRRIDRAADGVAGQPVVSRQDVSAIHRLRQSQSGQGQPGVARHRNADAGGRPNSSS